MSSTFAVLARRPAVSRLSSGRATITQQVNALKAPAPSPSSASNPAGRRYSNIHRDRIVRNWRATTRSCSGGPVVVASAAPKADTMLRTVSDMGELTVVMVDGTKLVQEAMDRHKCAPAAAVALGRGLIGTVLMGSFKKDGEATQVVFKGTGELGQMICVATSEGYVKGMVSNPNANAAREDGTVDVPSIVGSGTLSVVRSHPFWKEPYTGMVPIASGEIAEDLAQYLLNSEQQQCALAAGVSLNPDGTVAAAGGFLIRALPLISDETVDFLERNISELPSLTSLFMEGKTCDEITEMLLKDIGASPGADSLEPKYGPCDESELRDRMKRAVASLGKDEVTELLEEQGHVELTCDFCKLTIQFPREEVLATLEAANSQ